MIYLAGVSTVLLILFSVALAWVGRTFVRKAGARPIPDPQASRPRVAVLLALRGADPSIDACLEALFTQDYPDYEVRIVVDRESDPAWLAVRNAIERTGTTRVHHDSLRQRRATCSLKCSALLQMAYELPADVEVVALVDGDVLPHSHWLADLIAPLSDPAVGATYGIPWFTPRQGGWGAILRSTWWAVAGVAMALRGWVWGGTAAMRTSVLRDSGIEERWSRSLSSDTVLHDAITSLGHRVEWVPSLILANADECDARSFFEDVIRYLVVRRLYLPGWRPVRVIGGLLFASLGWGVGIAVLAWALGENGAAALAALGLVVYTVTYLTVFWVADRRARDTLRANGLPVPSATLLIRAKWLVGLALVHVLFLVGARLAQSARCIRWREVTYAVNGPWDISLTSDSLNEP